MLRNKQGEFSAKGLKMGRPLARREGRTSRLMQGNATKRLRVWNLVPDGVHNISQS